MSWANKLGFPVSTNKLFQSSLGSLWFTVKRSSSPSSSTSIQACTFELVVPTPRNGRVKSEANPLAPSFR